MAVYILQGWIQDFLKGGLNQEWIYRGGANPNIVSPKLGGSAPPEAMGYLTLFSTKIPYNARLECF